MKGFFKNLVIYFILFIFSCVFVWVSVFFSFDRVHSMKELKHTTFGFPVAFYKVDESVQTPIEYPIDIWVSRDGMNPEYYLDKLYLSITIIFYTVVILKDFKMLIKALKGLPKLAE